MDTTNVHFIFLKAWLYGNIFCRRASFHVSWFEILHYSKYFTFKYDAIQITEWDIDIFCKILGCLYRNTVIYRVQIGRFCHKKIAINIKKPNDSCMYDFSLLEEQTIKILAIIYNNIKFPKFLNYKLGKYQLKIFICT